MAVDIKVPPMGESITEATVAAWRRNPGDAVASGDILVELETDKVTMEVPAPASGVLKEVLKKSGDVVHVDEVLARIEEGAAPAAKPQPAASAAPAAAKPQAAAAQKNEVLPPGAKRLVEENRLDPAGIEGTGKRGQVTKADVVHHLESASGKTAEARAAGGGAVPAGAAATGTASQAHAGTGAAPATRREGREEKPVAMSRLRQRIAERLVEAQHTAAILTTFNEVDMSAVMDVRSRFKDKFKEKYGVNLGFMSFFAKACVQVLQEIPAINAEIKGTEVIYKNYCDIGVAVGGPKGLVVPIVRDADTKNFA
ncbi:MAG: 2-oxo acid dehydrogenase subunit E2, partial [Spirochaetia bacterium]|nr:2-oxo acid dehydrogenase subunit E2 [Spirochaetia bacterium]